MRIRELYAGFFPGMLLAEAPHRNGCRELVN